MAQALLPNSSADTIGKNESGKKWAAVYSESGVFATVVIGGTELTEASISAGTLSIVILDQLTWAAVDALATPGTGDAYQLTEATSAPDRADETSAAVGDIVQYSGSEWINVGPFVQGPTGSTGATGATGSAGTDGDDGWAPVLTVQTDGSRRVFQVTDWVGGAGTKPDTGDYVGASGLVSSIGDGVDVRGAAGATGATGSAGSNGANLAILDQDTYANIIALGSPSAGDAYQLTSASGAPNRGDGSSAQVNDIVQYSGSTWLNLGGAAQGPTGATGAAGTDGNDGWYPVLSLITSGTAVYLQVTDWEGGEGTKPDVGDYLGSSGYVTLIADAIDISGTDGSDFTILGQDAWTVINAIASPSAGDAYQLTNAAGTPTAPTDPEGNAAAVNDIVQYTGSAWINMGAPVQVTEGRVERRFYDSVSIVEESSHIFVVKEALTITAVEAELSEGGDGTVDIDIGKNGSAQSLAIAVDTAATSGDYKYKRSATSISCVAGDVISLIVDDNGASAASGDVAETGPLDISIIYTT